MVGVELMRVQVGGEPTDFKPLPGIGAGAFQIRVRHVTGAFRVVYVAKFSDAVYVAARIPEEDAEDRQG